MPYTIHHEVEFSAAPENVYRAILDDARFGAATGAAASIGLEESAAFSCFDGMITGRHVELVPNERIFLAGDTAARSAFLRLYSQLDTYIGWLREHAPDALFVVLSDHGQCEETHVAHVNGLLDELGYVRQVRERPPEIHTALGGGDVRAAVRVPAALRGLRATEHRGADVVRVRARVRFDELDGE